MEHDHFYEGLNPEYQQMLAHKVDGEQPAIYSNLLLAAWKQERHAEASDPLPPKTATTGGSNVTCSQTSGNLFLSCKLKGNHTFATWATTVGNNKAEEDPGKKPEGGGETELSADEDVEVLGRIGERDQSVKYIVHFMKAVKLYQRKNRNCFGCGTPEHFICDWPKDTSRSAQKVYLNMKEGMAKKEG